MHVKCIEFSVTWKGVTKKKVLLISHTPICSQAELLVGLKYICIYKQRFRIVFTYR